jgi:hypothetical protein
MPNLETKGPQGYEKVSCGYKVRVEKASPEEWLSVEEVAYIEKQVERIFFGLDKLNKMRVNE